MSAGSDRDGEPCDVTLTARDGVALAGSFFAAEGAPRMALLVNSGTGIPRGFYARFAKHAAARGFAVLTYDYRGIGGSAPASLVGCPARYRDWGQQDVPGAIDWLEARCPELPLVVVCHSTGGQQLGLADNVGRVGAALFVGVSTGYWRGMSWRYRLLSLVLWKAYIPLSTRVLGYAPARKVGWGENLPAGVAREWGAWCLEHDYMAAYFDGTGSRSAPDGAPFGPIHFESARFPIRSLYFTDDPIATRANAGPLLRLFACADVETAWLDPRDVGVDELGHLGFFRARFGAPLWDDALDWLIARGGGAPA